METMTTGIIQDQNLEKRFDKSMGCMAAFFNLFDRTHIVAGKRFYSKRLPPSSLTGILNVMIRGAVDSTAASEALSSVGSPSISRELAKPPEQPKPLPSPDRSKKQSLPQEASPEVRSPLPAMLVESTPPKSPLAVSRVEFKEGVRSPWKFTREAPRLSLDSRAVVDAKGSLHPREIRTNSAILSAADGDESEKQRRSPSVIARLMGLESLAPRNSSGDGGHEPSGERKRRANEAAERRRVSSPVQSPKLNSKRMDQTTSGSPRYRRPTAEIYSNEKPTVPGEDESSTISESSSYSTCSYTEAERWKMEEHKEGRSLLERCDKLLHSIAEMTATTELQPSPVSVLDSSFYKEEDSPSPVMKRTLHFRGQMVEDFEDETWSPSSSVTVQGNESDGSDFIYVTEILRASNYLPEDSDLFLLLEKQQFLKGKDTSKASRLQRKLIFDTITEILDRNRQLPPWKLVSLANLVSLKPTLGQIWSEFQRIRQPGTSEDLFDTICGVLKKDLAGDFTNGWGDCPVELSEVVLDIERLIFKDIISETIRDLAAFAGNSVASAPRRKLVF
ncbi:hypothetical protein Ancab_020161 [Ancistrocladus abbreviatus]